MQRHRGFTLIELLIVIAIIGILATLVTMALGKSRVKARNSEAKNNITEAGKSVEIFKDEGGVEDRVISTISSTNVDTLDGDESNNADESETFDNVFTGIMSVENKTYNLSITKTPSSDYVFTYSAPPPSVDGERDLQPIDEIGRCYLIYTSIVESDFSYFMINNGSGSDTNTPSC